LQIPTNILNISMGWLIILLRIPQNEMGELIRMDLAREIRISLDEDDMVSLILFSHGD